MPHWFNVRLARPPRFRAVWGILAFASASAVVSVRGAEVVDLRNGAAVTFYGGRFTGTPPVGDAYGWAMAFGDIDGDGYTDFISSSSNSEGPGDTQEPEHDVYIFFGRQHSAIDSLYAIDEPGKADIVIYRGGFALACADIDHDGYDDLILAEHRGYVIFGGPRASLRTVYDLDDRYPGYTAPDITILGSFDLGGGTNFPVGDFGIILALASGDLNGDGYADIAIGSPTANTGRRSGGATFIVFGAPRDHLPSLIDTDPSSLSAHPDVTIIGKGSDLFPFNLAIGDLDGDKVADLVASTTRGAAEETQNPLSGEVQVYLGRPQWKSLYDAQTEDFDFAIKGTAGYRFGYRLCTGDLDGDGRDEIIVGSPWTNLADVPDDRSFPGEYRIFFGRPRNMWSKWSDVNDATDVFILGASTYDVNDVNTPSPWAYAFSISTGNHDGDSYTDLLIGAAHASGPNETRGSAGEAYLLRGRPRGLWDPFIDLRDGYDLLVYGADAVPSQGFEFDMLGFATGLGDIDKDGFDDLFMSAIYADGPQNSSSDVGEIYAIFGKDSTTVSVGQDRSHPPLALSNYPNPFQRSTTIRFSASPGQVASLTVYDAQGRVVSRPMANATISTRETAFQWDARDERGAALPTGVYFVKLVVDGHAHARKVVLVR